MSDKVLDRLEAIFEAEGYKVRHSEEDEIEGLPESLSVTNDDFENSVRVKRRETEYIIVGSGWNAEERIFPVEQPDLDLMADIVIEKL